MVTAGSRNRYYPQRHLAQGSVSHEHHREVPRRYSQALFDVPKILALGGQNLGTL